MRIARGVSAVADRQRSRAPGAAAGLTIGAGSGILDWLGHSLDTARNELDNTRQTQFKLARNFALALEKVKAEIAIAFSAERTARSRRGIGFGGLRPIVAWITVPVRAFRRCREGEYRAPERSATKGFFRRSRD